MKIQQGCTSAIILNEKDEILFTKRSDSDDFLPGVWELPGGGIEYGETPQDSIKREIKEECGLEIEVVKPVSVNTYFMDEIQRIETCFLCKPITGNVKLSREHSDYKWLKMSNISAIKLLDYIKKVLKSAETNLS